MGQRCNVQIAGHILCSHHPHHTRYGVTRFGINMQNVSMRMRAEQRHQMQLTGEFQPVIDIHRFTADVFLRAFMFLAFAHAALQPRAEQRFHLSLRK
ncbi:hypothetical protein SRABI106_03106 [Rahnella aquatilis]|nr:hypothetical protein SRABI106_03106 [Rahnella aquatilis]